MRGHLCSRAAAHDDDILHVEAVALGVGRQVFDRRVELPQRNRISIGGREGIIDADDVEAGLHQRIDACSGGVRTAGRERIALDLVTHEKAAAVNIDNGRPGDAVVSRWIPDVEETVGITRSIADVAADAHAIGPWLVRIGRAGLETNWPDSPIANRDRTGEAGPYRPGCSRRGRPRPPARPQARPDRAACPFEKRRSRDLGRI